MEEATTRVFGEFGYRARVTAKSKDGGIDIILDHDTLGDVFAQVKHTRNKVGVRVLRELVGTMVRQDSKTSLLVTSSVFTGGVEKERALFGKRGFEIELVDGRKLLASLNLLHRKDPPSIEDILAVATPTVELACSEIHL